MAIKNNQDNIILKYKTNTSIINNNEFIEYKIKTDIKNIFIIKYNLSLINTILPI